MKIIAYGVREDELKAFEKFSKDFNMELKIVRKNLSPETVSMAEGFDGISFIGSCNLNREVFKKLSELGIKYTASRSIGYDNVDLQAAREFDIKVSNSSYSPYSVGEFAVMSAMILLRNIQKTVKHTAQNNFSIYGLMGRELRNQKIGIIGTGRIGKLTADIFMAMGAEVIAYDVYQNPQYKNIKYVSLETIFRESDIISLHVPFKPENRYMINKETISMMKDKVLIINTARGELINSDDLIEGLKNGKIAGAALDTFEHENDILFRNFDNNFVHPQIKELLSMENVIITPHQAFYTDQAVSDMVESSLSNLDEFIKTGDARNNLIK